MRVSRFLCLLLLLLVAPGSPAERLNGLLLDPVRLPESMEYYRRFLDFARDWGMRAVIFRIADDQGVAVRFPSHPELIAHKNAFTAQEVRTLAEYAAARGIELIPEIESFGHTRYITGVPQYADLLDGPRDASNFSGLVPVDARSIRIISDLYRDAAAMFPSRYIHGGCDEVNWGGSERSKDALKNKSRAQIWGEYLNSLDAAARGLNKELIVWGDHILRKESGILERLNKDIIILDWDYWTSDPAEIEKTARKALTAGFRIIGGPALTWCKWGPRPGAEQLRNIDAYADTYRKIDDPRCLGVIMTNWMPGRYLQNSIWDGLAYGAVAIREGSQSARNTAFRRFVEKHYGAEWNDTWADIFRTCYDIAPNRSSCAPKWMQPVLPAPWSNPQELAAVFDYGLRNPPPFTRLLSQMVLSEPRVRRNLADFRSFRLSAEYLEQLYWRDAAVLEAADRKLDGDALAALLGTIAERDRRLLAELNADWDRGRPADSPIKSEQLFDAHPEDQLLYRFSRAAACSAELAARGTGLRPVRLFDGKTFSGWSKKGGGTWTIEDGAIHTVNSGGDQPGGFLISDRSFKDLTLRLKFKMIKGNSGVFVRADQETMASYEVEIDDTRGTGGLFETGPAGRKWVHRPEDNAPCKAGEWNQLTASLYGHRIVFHVNGVKTLDLANDTQGRMEGHIGLQNHGRRGSDIWFKDIEVLEGGLPSSEGAKNR